MYFIGQLGAYLIAYRKASLALLYFYLLTFNIPQMIRNMTSAFIEDEILSNCISFALGALLSAFVFLYLKKKSDLPFIRDVVRAVPVWTYILLLVFVFIASVFIEIENRNYSPILKESFLLLPMTAMIAAAVSVVRISISEAEKRSSLELLSRQVEDQIEYYEKINRIYGEFRSFRHDQKNHFLCLRSLIGAGKNEEAIEYMETMQEMSAVDKNRYHTGNVIIDALLDDKSEKVEKAGAIFLFEGAVPDNGVSNADLCIIMANVIDNAVEACAKGDPDDAKEIRLTAETRRGYFFFKASDPLFEAVTVNGDKLIATSKSDKDDHGFGIYNIVRIAEKYEGETNISTEEDIFTIEVMLHLKTEL